MQYRDDALDIELGEVVCQGLDAENRANPHERFACIYLRGVFAFFRIAGIYPIGRKISDDFILIGLHQIKEESRV